MQEIVKQWLAQARADFTTARHCFTSKDYYFSSRYPGAATEIPAKFYDKKKASVHLKEARVILAWVKEKIQ